MEAACSTPTRSFIISAIKTSIDHKILSFGKSLHSISIKIGFFTETPLCNHLINMYSKCESLDSAHKLFDEMPQKDLISYSTLLASNSRSGNPILALHLLSQLKSEELAPNQFVFSSSIAACARLDSIGFGRQIHAQVVASGFRFDPFVSTALVDMYSKFGELDLAISSFNQSGVSDPVLFNSMVSGCVSVGANEEALLLFKVESKFGYFKPTEFSFGILMKACSDLSKDIGIQFHGLMMKYGFNSSCFAATSLVDFYGRIGLVESLEKASEEILSYDIALYNAMIGGFSRNGYDGITLDCFGELVVDGFVPNECTFAGALKSCSALKSDHCGRMIHGVVEKTKFSQHLIVKTALIDMYMKCGKVEESCRMFDTMIERNTVSYNSMILGLGQNGCFDEATRLFVEMKSMCVGVDSSTFVALMSSCSGRQEAAVVYGDAVKHGLGSDLMITNSLLSCLIRRRSVEEAIEFFRNMKERNVVSWTTIISGLIQMDLHAKAIEIFKEMLSSSVEIFPNSFTFSSIFKACGNSASIKHGRCIHGCGIKHGVMDDDYTNSSLLDMYAKCGALDDSRRLFDEMSSEEIVSWNAMIAAYAQHGRGEEALEIYTMMEDRSLEPNHVTFVSLLSACSHCGMLDAGVRLFELMVSKHGIAPLMEHCACMVYLFGRAGLLDRAKQFIDSVMPFEADASIWTVFLAACKLHGRFELAEMAREKLDGMVWEDNPNVVLASNMLSEVGRWDDAERERKKIGAEGTRKEPGLSWVMQVAEGFG